MTNMFLGVPAEQLCDQHLLGLHKELHQEAGTLENHPHGYAIAAGHFRLGQIATDRIQDRHEEVVREMERRGMNHGSPLQFRDRYGLTSSMLGQYPVIINQVSLASRCEDCL